jgi:sarcosine oxidase
VRVTVVGCGVVGLLTAVECVLAGHEVTVVDQADLPSVDATSFDRHKMLRAVHPDDQGATSAALAAHGRWLALERLLASRFYDRVGALTVLPAERLPTALSVLWNSGTQARALDAAELAQRYPDVRCPAGAVGVLESDAGVLLADRVLAAGLAWLRWQSGVTLLARRPVVEVGPGPEPTVVLADGEVLAADRVVLAAGPWSRALLPAELAAGLTLYRQSMLYCQVPAERRDAWASTPAIPALGTGSGAWLVPPVAGTPLKLSAASVCRPVAELADHDTEPRWRAELVEVFGAVLPGFTPEWVTGARDCYYLADTATGGAAVLAPGPGVLALAACGGVCFKFAPLIARTLAGRSIGTAPAPTGRRWLADAPRTQAVDTLSEATP